MSNAELATAIDEFRGLLVPIKQEIAAAPPHRARFEAVLTSMFGPLLLARGATALGLAPEVIPPLQDNLDTGNAYHAPFPQFASSLQRALADADASRPYRGPEAMQELTANARLFAQGSGLVSAAAAGTLGVVAGAGTVHLYDCVCRLVVQRPGDGVIVPTPTYGFFLPQIERSAGEVIALPLGADGRVDPTQLEQLVTRSNAQRWTQWRCELAARLELAKLRWPDVLAWDALGASLLLAGTRQQADTLLAQGIQILGDQLVQALSPPRVAAFLHINPHVNGAAMGEADLAAIARILAAHQVVVIEDLAYHSMPVGTSDAALTSLLGGAARTYTLLGFSKPFAVAAHRVGVLLSHECVQPLQRLVENSIGFVPPAVQQAMAALLGSGVAALKAYHDAAANDPAEGYTFKRDLLLTLIQGARCDGSAEPTPVNKRIARELQPLVHMLGMEHDTAARFMRQGLSDLLTVQWVPQAGIFVLVSCRPFLQLPWAQALQLTSSFDFFAWAAFFTGVRSIPQEAMGGLHACHVLRLSFSPPVVTLVRAAFLVWVAAQRFASVPPAAVTQPHQ